MPDPVAPQPISPTGKPLVPPSVVPYIAALAVLAIVLAGLGELELVALPPKLLKLAEGLVAVALAMLGASPGLRGGAAIAAVQAVQAAESRPEEPKP